MYFDKFPNLSTFLSAFQCRDRGMFLFKLSHGSDVVMQEVEMVESVDDLKTSQSVREHQFPNFC